MDYELAKKLKDAGFPQKVNGGFQTCKHGAFLRHQKDCPMGCSESDFVKYPTLSELIEACGEDFNTLTRYGKSSNSGWRVWGWSGNDDVDGDTPEEAVANLWLELRTS